MKHKRTTIYMADDIHKAMRMLSVKTGQSMSDMVNKILRNTKHIKNELKSQGGAGNAL